MFLPGACTWRAATGMDGDSGKVFYLHALDGIGRSRLVSNIESCLGVPATGRNLNTVLKLREMSQHV